jgi:hypothetical protein
LDEERIELHMEVSELHRIFGSKEMRIK